MASPLDSSASRTSSTIVSDWSCLTERLTLIVSGGVRGNRSWRTSAPGGRPPASTQRPIGTIRPVSSASGMKLSGLDQPARRVLPAKQRLDAVVAALIEANDGLVVDLELVQLERPLQLRLQLEPLDDALVHRRLEDAVAALAVALRHVHGDVGVAEQLLGVG